MRRFANLVFWTLVAVVLPSVALAADDGGTSGAAVALAADGGGTSGAAIGAGLAMGMAGLGCGIGQGLTAGNTTAGIARNPGAAGAMLTYFILGMALIESIALIAFVTAILLMP